MLIDTHCHLNFSAFKQDRDEVIKKTLAKNIWLINVGSQFTTSQRAVEIANQYHQGVYAAVGLHPIHLYEIEVDENEEDIHFRSRAEVFDYDKYKELAVDPKVLAIGEMGIDYFHLPEGEDPEEVKRKQKETFLQGIELARELDKPIIVHTRPSKGTFDAYDDEVDILRQIGYFHGVIHSFLGTFEQAQTFLQMGFYLSFNGIVTFKNAKEVQEVARKVPLERVLLETDAPYLTPEPYRGQRNEPAYVEYVARKIAELKGISFEEVAEITTNNARRLFGI